MDVAGRGGPRGRIRSGDLSRGLHKQVKSRHSPVSDSDGPGRGRACPEILLTGLHSRQRGRYSQVVPCLWLHAAGNRLRPLSPKSSALLSAPSVGKGSKRQDIGRISSTHGCRVPNLSSGTGVEHGGFEPPTPCLPGKCSPAELMPREGKSVAAAR